MLKPLWYTLTLILLNTMSAFAQPAHFEYVTRQPKLQSAHPPVIVLLHGVGSNERDLFSFADQLPGRFLVLSLRAPIALGGDSFAWYPVDFSTGKPVFNFEEEEKSRLALIAFLKTLPQKFSADPQNIYLCGFSQGAIMSYSVSLTQPGLVKGIAVLSGRLLEEIKPQVDVTDKKLAALKVFISHGTSDQVLPVAYARSANTYLTSIGIAPVYKEYAAPHTVTSAMLHDLVQWLEGK